MKDKIIVVVSLLACIILAFSISEIMAKKDQKLKNTFLNLAFKDEYKIEDQTPEKDEMEIKGYFSVFIIFYLVFYFLVIYGFYVDCLNESSSNYANDNGPKPLFYLEFVKSAFELNFIDGVYNGEKKMNFKQDFFFNLVFNEQDNKNVVRQQAHAIISTYRQKLKRNVFAFPFFTALFCQFAGFVPNFLANYALTFYHRIMEKKRANVKIDLLTIFRLLPRKKVNTKMIFSVIFQMDRLYKKIISCAVVLLSIIFAYYYGYRKCCAMHNDVASCYQLIESLLTKSYSKPSIDTILHQSFSTIYGCNLTIDGGNRYFIDQYVVEEDINSAMKPFCTNSFKKFVEKTKEYINENDAYEKECFQKIIAFINN